MWKPAHEYAVLFLNFFTLGTFAIPFPNIRILTPTVYPPFSPRSYVYIAPAIETALREIKVQYPFLNITHEPVFNPSASNCSEWERDSDFYLASSYYRDAKKTSQDDVGVSAIICAGCTEVLSLANFAKHWNVLLITTVEGLASRDKTRYPTWITTSITSTTPFIHAYRNLVVKFQLASVTFLTDASSSPFFTTLSIVVRRDLSQVRGIRLQTDDLKIDSAAKIDFNRTLNLFRRNSRVCLYFGNAKLLRTLLVAAHRLKMTNGQYVFIAVSAYKDSPSGIFSWKVGDLDDEIAKVAFGSFFVLETDAVGNSEGNGTSRALENVWKQQSAQTYNYTYGKNEQVTPIPSATYSAFMVFAQVISELYTNLRNGNSLKDGATLTKAYVNRTYHLRTGDVTLDNVGERMLGIKLLQMDVNRSRTYLREVMFQDSNNFAWSVTGNISWYENASWPVRSQPLCDVEGGACAEANPVSTVLISCGGLLCCLIIISLVVMMHSDRFLRGKSAGQISDEWWVISPGTITIAKNLTLLANQVLRASDLPLNLKDARQFWSLYKRRRSTLRSTNWSYDEKNIL